jgi:hypothetical protein
MCGIRFSKVRSYKLDVGAIQGRLAISAISFGWFATQWWRTNPTDSLAEGDAFFVERSEGCALG